MIRHKMLSFLRRVIDSLLVIAALGLSLAAGYRLVHAGKTRVVGDTEVVLDDPSALYAVDRRIGPPNAPFQMLVWTDYQCPACRRLEPELLTLRGLLGDSLTITYRHFPLAEVHPAAFKAAQAAECARERGSFEVVHDFLFLHPLVGPDLPLDSMMASTGILDSTAYRVCVAVDSFASVVDSDLSLGRRMGLAGTPTILIGDRLRLGGAPASVLAERLRSATHGRQP